MFTAESAGERILKIAQLPAFECILI